MTTSDYMDLILRAGGLSLAIYALVGQVAKPALRMMAKRHAKGGKLSRGQEEFYRWLTRALCVCIGGLVGLAPLWPEWLQSGWGPIIGCVSGSMSPGIYVAVSKALPARIKKIISGASVSGRSE